MKAKNLSENVKILLYLTISAALVILCVKYSHECYVGVAAGIGFCIDVLVPSLFMLMAVSSLIIKSGASEYLCQPLRGVTRKLFGLPPCCLSPIVLGLIGGYPVGAKCVKNLYDSGRINESQAQKTAMMAVAAGPGFLINYVGCALLGNQTLGTYLLAAQTLAVLVTGMVVGRTMKCPLSDERIRPLLSTENILTESVRDASAATMSMCSMVVLFSAVSEVARTLAGDTPLSDILSAILEITTGCNRMCGRYAIPLVAFFVGFGGLSVHFQIFSLLRNITLKKSLFFLYRIICGILTAVFAYIIVRTFPQSTAVFSSVDAPVTADISANTWGSTALIAASGCFLLSITGGNYVRNSRMAQQNR